MITVGLSAWTLAAAVAAVAAVIAATVLAAAVVAAAVVAAAVVAAILSGCGDAAEIRPEHRRVHERHERLSEHLELVAPDSIVLALVAPNATGWALLALDAVVYASVANLYGARNVAVAQVLQLVGGVRTFFWRNANVIEEVFHSRHLVAEECGLCGRCQWAHFQLSQKYDRRKLGQREFDWSRNKCTHN